MIYTTQKFARRLKALHSRLKGCQPQRGHQPHYGIPGEILLTESSTFDESEIFDESDSPSQMTQI